MYNLMKLELDGELYAAEYRMLPVKNYLVFYVVTEHDVEIHRIVYSKMDITKIIR